MGLLFLSAPDLHDRLAGHRGRLTDRVGPRIPATIGVLDDDGRLRVGLVLEGRLPLDPAGHAAGLTGIGQGFFNTPNQTAIIGSVPREYRGFATGMVQMMFGLGSLLGISLGGVLLTQFFRHYSGIPDATPSAADPGAFVAAMSAIYAVCFALMTAALLASLMRGGRRVQAAAME